MSDTNTSKSVGTMLSDAMGNLSSLVRNEVDLARAEVSESLSQAGVAIGMLAGAAIIALVALNVLAAALVAALAETGLDEGWAALIVGVILAVFAFVLMAKGRSDLKLSNLAPKRTVRNVKRDAEAVKETYNDK